MDRANRGGNRVTRVPLRHLILDERISPDDLIRLLVRRYVDSDCDGLFLPAVDYLGVRLPVRKLVRTLERVADVRFAVLDGAQTLGHVPVDLNENCCDFFLGGCHKWLCAHNPMGIAFYGHPRSTEYVNQMLRAVLDKQQANDPLLWLTDELEIGQTSRFEETVNLMPLFTCQGAVDDALKRTRQADVQNQRIENANRLFGLAGDFGWQPLCPDDSLRTGICLLTPTDREVTSLSPNVLRERFHRMGVALTTYQQGLIRLSMPAKPWHDVQIDTLATALKSCGLSNTN